MKLHHLYLFFIVIACSTIEDQAIEKVISKETFGNILYEIHLAEATFELNKKHGTEKAKNYLSCQYDSIYSTYKIDQKMFESSLAYYAKHPHELEVIYTLVLDKLTAKKINLQ